jgi:hypothetical protein
MTKRKEFVQDLQDALQYDPISGLFYWHEQSKPFRKWGHKPAGSASSNGYLYIAYKKKKYLAHRLAFFFMTGSFPDRGIDVDHINGNRSDNRFSNLRLCNRADNLANSNLSKGGLPRGVQKNGNNYMAKIRRNNQTLYLGTFKTPEQANDAYKQARQSLLNDFIIQGKSNEICH